MIIGIFKYIYLSFLFIHDKKERREREIHQRIGLKRRGIIVIEILI